MSRLTDDLGRSVVLPAPPTRIVSLVPSVTECLFALGAGATVVGVTRFCIEPAAARAVARVGGTKNPDLERICALHPDLVVANAEENRLEDVEVLDAAGIPVFVTFPRTVEGGIAMVRTIGTLVGHPEAGRQAGDRLERELAAVVVAAGSAPRRRVFCPIWKRPWMTFNRDTFADAMLRAVGAGNVCADLSERYPVVDAATLAGREVELVLLPSEPYHFGEKDRADVDALLADSRNLGARVCYVDGRDLTWYGPRIDRGLRHLRSVVAGDLVAATGP